MKTFSIIAIIIACINAHHLVNVAGEVSKNIASPETKINLGQMQVAKINIAGSSGFATAGRMMHHDDHAFTSEMMPHIDHIEEATLGAHVESAGPSVIKGCYKVTPVYKTHYKQEEDFKTVHHKIKVMVPEFKTIKTFRKVERVVHDVVPEFKQIETTRPEYRTVTKQIPYMRTVPYKVKSYIKSYLPPHEVDEPKYETYHSHHSFKPTEDISTISSGDEIGSPKIKVKVGSLANYGQSSGSSQE